MNLAGPSGAPVGPPFFKLYNNTTLLASTANIVAATAYNNQNWWYGYFSSTQTVQPNTTVRVSCADASADSSSNYYRGQELTVDSDSNSLNLMPFEGTAQKTTYNGTSWTDTNTGIFPFALLLDSTGEFGPPGVVPHVVMPCFQEVLIDG